MAYTAPEMILIGTAQDLVLGPSFVVKCVSWTDYDEFRYDESGLW